MSSCYHCGDPFILKRSDAMYCSKKCKVAAFRAASKSPETARGATDKTSVSSNIIEASFREVPPQNIPSQASSQSRALVPVIQPGQPFDSRTAAALRQHAAAKGRDRRPTVRVPGGLFSTFDQMFALPDEAANEAEAARLEAERFEIEADRAQLANERAEAVRAVAVRPTGPTMEQKWQGALMALTRLPMLNAERSKEAISERHRLEEQNEALRNELQKLKNGTSLNASAGAMSLGALAAGQRREANEGAADVSASEPPDDDDFPGDDFLDDPDDVPDHIDDARYARAEQQRQAATGSYGSEPFAVIEHANGRAQVKPMLPPASLHDLALFNKLERLRRERQAEREATRSTPDRSRNLRVAEFFRRKKLAPENEPASRPKSWSARFSQWLTAPSKPPVWR